METMQKTICSIKETISIKRSHTVAPKFTDEEWSRIDETLASVGLKKTHFFRQAILEKLARDFPESGPPAA